MPNQELKFDLTYSVPPVIIYEAITDQMKLCQFTQGQAVSETKPGGKFMMYDGMITGEYVTLVENQSLELKWRMKDWAADVLSSVHITF